MATKVSSASSRSKDTPSSGGASARPFVVGLAGSPNTGKTTLFNGLTGLRAQTANFSGTTVERKRGWLSIDGADFEVLDLPGLYSLRSATAEERIAADVLLGKRAGTPKPDAVVVIANADNMERSLFLISQLLEHHLPVVVALNMVDVADSHGIHVNVEELKKELGCPVVPMVARGGRGLDELRAELFSLREASLVDDIIEFSYPEPACDACGSCPFQSRYSWSDKVASRCVKAPRVARGRKTEVIDRMLTHPWVGLTSFLGVMLAVFYLIFAVATIPMDMIDALFGNLGGWIARHVPDGDFQSLLVDGIIGGVGGILVFLPQICILFFFLAVLEDSGYLARAAFVMDRLMRRIGLPGTAFVPLLSAHACAIPAIMASRVIRDPRDRLVTILVAPGPRSGGVLFVCWESDTQEAPTPTPCFLPEEWFS